MHKRALTARGVPLGDLHHTGTQYASIQTPMQLARQSADEKQCCKDGNTGGLGNGRNKGFKPFLEAFCPAMGRSLCTRPTRCYMPQRREDCAATHCIDYELVNR